uniref:Adenosylmethionine-8-amino-7-oxononanoate aminotransferase n=1 Tax=Candidatus Aschnera chinzeii TaxID=1485666 RepID=A0AAT9G4T2_9ENTR|nr:MAG: adenosylmethionine--8-amino-7-oxononanoate transaminase [Candidatus Aschnera chinzeii]
MSTKNEKNFMNKMSKLSDITFDANHIWHPYSSISHPTPNYYITSASGVELTLQNGKKLIDGMSSWWSVIHGYNHPVLNKAAIDQLNNMSHIMFGGIIHQPAIALCKQLVDITDKELECVFLADSGSVAIEVALKMAIQYWHAVDEDRKQFVALEHAYHGDTFGAMSICDPQNSMHNIYQGYIPNQLFVKSPKYGFYEEWKEDDIQPLEQLLMKNYKKIAAIIIEPIVQGAGGMRIYNYKYLIAVKKLCKYYNILLIFDEIATGFGRTGKLFAYEYASIAPDILCIGKALTGGYLTLSATMTTRKIANTICSGKVGHFMHGPTFMGNPLACAIANANITLLRKNYWKKCIKNIEIQLIHELSQLKKSLKVHDVRILGAIAVIEMKNKIDVIEFQKAFVNAGVWIRPFGKLIYLMPPYIITSEQLNKLTYAIKKIIYSKC